jgi:hypothetical protein
MYARFFFLLLIFSNIASVSLAEPALNELQTTVTVRLDAGYWQHRAEALATMRDSKYYHQGFVPTLFFDNMRHYGTTIQLNLKGFAVGYSYTGSSILGKIYPPDYKTEFKDADGEKIRMMTAFYKNQKFDFGYLYRQIAGIRLSWQKYYYQLSPTDNWNDLAHPLGGGARFESFCKGWSCGFWGNPNLTKNVTLKWSAGFSPSLKGRYEYPHTSESGGVSMTSYSEYFAEVLLGYYLKCGIVPSLGLSFKRISAQKINVTDTFKNIILSLEYTF